LILAPAPPVAEVLIGKEQLHARVGSMGQQIGDDYATSSSLLLVGMLTGTTFFLADLMRAIPPTVPVSLDFMALTRYNSQAGSVRIIKDVELAITDRDVLLVKNIVDTGLSVSYVMRVLRARQPRSLRLCVLLDRHSVRLLDIPMHYIGFTIPDRYVVGYGMDMSGHYRNLPYIGVLPADVNQPAALHLAAE
jgi:hypoxanthine phosphoribosyltransferase